MLTRQLSRLEGLLEPGSLFGSQLSPARELLARRDHIAPPMQLWSNENAAVVTVELPGVDPDNIEISVEDRVLTVTATREQTHEDALRSERRYGRYQRQLRLPFEVDLDTAHARSVHGVLEIQFDRSEADRPRRIEIVREEG